MYKAIIEYNGEQATIEIGDGIKKLIDRLNNEAEIHLNKLKRPDGTMDWLKKTDDVHDDESSDIVDSFFWNKANEIFEIDINDLDIIMEGHQPKGDEYIYMVFRDLK